MNKLVMCSFVFCASVLFASESGPGNGGARAPAPKAAARAVRPRPRRPQMVRHGAVAGAREIKKDFIDARNRNP